MPSSIKGGRVYSSGSGLEVMWSVWLMAWKSWNESMFGGSAAEAPEFDCHVRL